MSRRVALVAVVTLVQLLLVGAGVWPQLSARFVGEEYRLAVAPVDPVDPFRGAYVRLTYPGLPLEGGRAGDGGTVYVPLVQAGAVWEGAGVLRQRPAEGPYLACEDEGWAFSCGIESLFASQERARRLEQVVTGGAVAVVRVDGDGNAALVDLEPAAS